MEPLRFRRTGSGISISEKSVGQKSNINLNKYLKTLLRTNHRKSPKIGLIKYYQLLRPRVTEKKGDSKVDLLKFVKL